MNILLEVVSPNAMHLGDRCRVEFGPEGGTIGRDASCNLVLPSPNKFVSRQHANIQFSNGTFYITSLSDKAGVRMGRLLSVNQAYPLRSGDRFVIDEYEISATLLAGYKDASPLPFSTADEPLGEPFGGGESVNPLDFLPGGEKAGGSYRGVPEPHVLQEAAPARRVEVRPAVGGKLPVDPRAFEFTKLERDSDSPEPVAAKSPAAGETPEPEGEQPGYREVPRELPARDRPAQGANSAVDIDALLQAAGISREKVSPEVCSQLGAIIAMAVQGTIDALRARDELRSQFHLSVTRVGNFDNNPLTFAANAKDALNSLFNRSVQDDGHRAFLGPVEAFARAFDDLKHHQVATAVGMRAGFDSMMNRFSPETLQARFDKQNRGGLLSSVVGPAYWDRYKNYFGELQDDADQAFRHLFGEEFALGYAKQIEALKRARDRRAP